MEQTLRARQMLMSGAKNEQEYRDMVSSLASSGYGGGLDEGYLGALLFPEFAPAARIPTPFGIPSSLVTQKFTFYVNTGSGDGLIVLLPQDQTGPCCYRGIHAPVYSPSGTTPSTSFPMWNGQASNLHAINLITESDGSYLADSFSHMRLVGASMRVTYTGSHEQEQGFFVGSHVYDKRPCELSEDSIEDGYYITRTRPSDGIRLSYQPRDSRDFEFFANDHKWGTQYGASAVQLEERWPQEGVEQAEPIRPLRPSDIFTGGTPDTDTIIETPNYNIYQWKMPHAMANNYNLQFTTPVNQLLGWQEINRLEEGQMLPLQTMWGQGPRLGQSPMPAQLCVYFKGLAPYKEALRVDVVRHFECIPRNTVKDLIAVDRPVPNEDSIDLASRIGPALPQVHSSTLDVSRAVHDGVRHQLMKNNKHTLGPALRNVFHPSQWSDRTKDVLKKLGLTVFNGVASGLLGDQVSIGGLAADFQKTHGGVGQLGSVPFTGNLAQKHGFFDKTI